MLSPSTLLSEPSIRAFTCVSVRVFCCRVGLSCLSDCLSGGLRTVGRDVESLLLVRVCVLLLLERKLCAVPQNAVGEFDTRREVGYIRYGALKGCVSGVCSPHSPSIVALPHL